MQRVYDFVVVGGGILGTATARELLIRNPGKNLALIEKECLIAAHQSGHNSGVIHSGIYYTPGSLKAKLCVEGSELAYTYFSEKQIPYKKCGKLIVAVKRNEISRLDALYKRAVENGVKDVILLDQKGIKELEPNISGLKALWSPNTGIVDWKIVTESFAEDCKSRNADIYLNFPVKGFHINSKSQIIIRSNNKEIICKHVITCGGLHSDKLAIMTGCSSEPRIIPFRGEYLVLKPDKCHLVKTNIYPVPYPNLPFLGVHITPRIDGSVWLGPNAILALHREGYRISDFNVKDMLEFLTFRGLRRLAGKHLMYGLSEVYKAVNMTAQVEVLKQYLPLLNISCVMRGPSGVRAQALDKNGNLVDDFIFDTGTGPFKSRVLHVRNAPSPAATSSLAIAKVVVDRVEKQFSINKS